MNITENLNDVQREIVTDTEGAVLVLAGAGSGKTRVLTHRVAYLVSEKKVPGYNILAITFTNKATAEMKERLKILLGEDNGVWVSTFHSFAARILRRYAEDIGYGANFSIYDESDSKRVISKALREMHLDGSAIKDSVRDHISKAKNFGFTPEEYYAEINGVNEHAEDIKRVYERYEELLAGSNAMDFDDLLHKLKFLFENSPAAIGYCRNRFRYVHVDEFQDTNKIQYELVKMIAADSHNIFVVGDDDQSIYGWRGAEIGNILNFDKEFPEAKVYKLTENYRSTSAILECANNVIRNNRQRHGKELFTKRTGGVRVEFRSAFNDHQESEWVVDEIGSLIRYNGYRPSDFAILVRANSLTRLFEQKLGEARLAYKVIGGFKFFDRKEIQDVVAYMRMIANNRDNEAVERIVNVPARGIGDATVNAVGAFAREQAISLFDVMLEINKYESELGARIVKKVEDFRALISDLVAHAGEPIYSFTKYLVERVGFENYYTASGTEEDYSRWENIKEFLAYVREYEEKNEGATVNEFLENVSLVRESGDELEDNDKVTVATMHAVKGLEFKVVFIVGCEEETFPSAQALKSNDIEEERRVMYVAITRARERLYISNAQRRFRYNRVEYLMPSRFVDEAKGKDNDSYGAFGARRNYVNGLGPRPDFLNAASSEVSKIRHSAATAPAPKKQTAPAPAKDLSGFVGGAKVVHPRYGEGTVLVVLGSGSDTTATVAFPNLGVKKFILALAPLTLKKE